MKRQLIGAMALLLWFTTCCTVSSFAQPWVDLMDKGDKDSFKAAKEQFEAFWKGKTPEKGKGFKPFLRWQNYWDDRLMPDGSLPKAGTCDEEYKKYKKEHGFAPDEVTSSLTAVGNWTPLGPTSSTGGYSGIGRINAIAFDPTNSSVIYIGSAGGGAWKTTNGGTSWTPLTDFSSSLGISSILVDPVSPNTIYLATGDGDGRDSPSIGILKSTDGGSTWSSTGLNWVRSDLRYTRKLVKNPTGGRILVATSIGIFYTDNAGTSWTQANTGVFYDLEQMPGSTGTFYATAVNGTTAQVFRSTDNGVTWTQVHSLASSNRAELTVSAANTNYVGVVYSKSADSGFNGFYSSVNGGTAWSLKASTPNLLGWNATGNDAGGQGWYDNAGSTWSSIKPNTGTETGGWITPFALAPNTPATMYIGYKNIWRSTNSGTSWSKRTTNLTGGVNIRHIAVAPNSATTVYVCSDADLSTGNRLYKTTDGFSTFTTLTNPTNVGRIAWITIDNTNANNIWVAITGYNAGQKVFKSTTGGTSWTNVSGTLPNIPANCVTYSNGSNGGVYLGMDVGVYYRDNTMSDWVLFSAQLPNVEIADLEIQYSLGKVRAATYGRGVWESDLYGTTPFVAPELAGKLSDKELQKTNFKVYPNPAQDVLNVEFYAAEAGASRLYILDLMGRVQTKDQVVEMVQGYNKVNIQITDLPNGVYYLTNGKGKSVRFVKTTSSSN